MSDKLHFIEHNPREGIAEASVIWMHGLGASGHDFLPVVQQLSLSYPKVRFILPHAPMRAVRANNGLRMRAWYDLYHWNFGSEEDVEGLQSMALSIHQLIEQEQSLNIPLHRIMLAGFSQGGAMALYVALRYPHALAGVIALSTYLPDEASLPAMTEAQKALPIFLAHGVWDGIIPLSIAQYAHQTLERLGCAVEWHTYSMEHNVVNEEIEDIAKFLGKVLY